MAHARRKFHELWANHEQPGRRAGAEVLRPAVRRRARGRRAADAEQRLRIRRRASHGRWPMRCTSGCAQQRQKVPDGSATAKAIDYSLKRWAALTRYLDDGDLPIDNNWVENQIRPIAHRAQRTGCSPAALRAGKRAAAIMSLVHSAKLNGHDPYAYLQATCSSGCRRSRPAASTSCCRIAGKRRSLPSRSRRDARQAMISELKNIAALIEDGGEITLGHLDAIGKCVATATAAAQCLAMLVRRNGESLDALLQRLDGAIIDAYENDLFTDEVNAPSASGSTKPRR